ncbi:MAG: SUMF1/EgtB/PvdO family nonheme iron enzyme [Anaerovoracaceae bacterium]
MENVYRKTAILYDDVGKPSEMVQIPKFLVSDVIQGGPDIVHPAFIIDGKERECIYISKYQNIVEGERAYSLPNKDPDVLHTPIEINRFCRNKGKNWHLMTSAEWAAVSLWSRKNNTIPRGNNDGGRDWKVCHEHGKLISLDGIVPEGEEGPPKRVATGSGPATWSHDGSNDGIFDMNGNVWELTSGMRTVNGILQVIKENDAAVLGIAVDKLNEKDWKCISESGTLVDNEEEKPLRMIAKGEWVPEVSGMSLTHDVTNDQDETTDGYLYFKDFKAPIQEKTVGSIVEQLTIVPPSDNLEDNNSNVVWDSLKGVRYPIRGGYWVNKEMAGIFSYGFYMQPNDKYFDVGFRCCYFEE